MSPDVEFGIKGARSGIEYQKFFHAFKKFLLDGMRDNTRSSRRIMEHYKKIVFPGTDSVMVHNEADSSGLELEMEGLDISDEAGSDLDRPDDMMPSSNLGLEYISSASQNVAGRVVSLGALPIGTPELHATFPNAAPVILPSQPPSIPRESRPQLPPLSSPPLSASVQPATIRLHPQSNTVVTNTPLTAAHLAQPPFIISHESHSQLSSRVSQPRFVPAVASAAPPPIVDSPSDSELSSAPDDLESLLPALPRRPVGRKVNKKATPPDEHIEPVGVVEPSNATVADPKRRNRADVDPLEPTNVPPRPRRKPAQVKDSATLGATSNIPEGVAIAIAPRRTGRKARAP